MNSHFQELPGSMEALPYSNFTHQSYHQPITSIPTSVIQYSATAASHPVFDPKLLQTPLFLSLLQAPSSNFSYYSKPNSIVHEPPRWTLPPLYSAIVQHPIQKTTPTKPVPLCFSNAPLFQPYLNDNFSKHAQKPRPRSPKAPYEKPLDLRNKKSKTAVKIATNVTETVTTFNPNSPFKTPKHSTLPIDSRLKLSQVIDKIFTDAFERCMIEE